MKKLLLFFAIVSVAASCSDRSTDTEATKPVVGVSDSNLYKNNTVADTGHVAPVPAPAIVAPTTKTVERIKTRKPSTANVTPKPTPAPSKAPVSSPGTVNTDTTGVAPAKTSTASAPAEVPKKKGWSNAAKGATIGGVGGAVGGAIISKKKGKGAIIGGVLGAAGGYIIGRKKDKKEQAASDTIK